MADGYRERLIQDLPRQFKGKKRVEAFLEVVGKQLDQVQAFYGSLNLERALATAQGIQLDRIGSILVLTRAEAGLLIQDNEDYVVDDDTYRYILAYKTMLNNSSATYYDIVRGIKRFYNLEIIYSETPDEPAAFMLEVGSADANIPLRNILPVKAAGVLCYYRFRLGGEADAIEVSEKLGSYPYSGLECGIPPCGTYWLTATIGNTGSYEVDAEKGSDGYGYAPDFAGTIPEIATLGQTDSAAINAAVEDGKYTDDAEESGDVLTGTVPGTATVGETDSVSTGTSSEVNGYADDADLTGTLPNVATVAETAEIAQEASVRSEASAMAARQSGAVYCGQ